jgi:hypothetical protein
MYESDDIWSHFEPTPRNHDGAWFLCEPAVPPFRCTEAAAEVWLQMEREMWEFYVQRSLESDAVPLFPETACRPSVLPAHLL